MTPKQKQLELQAKKCAYEKDGESIKNLFHDADTFQDSLMVMEYYHLWSFIFYMTQSEYVKTGKEVIDASIRTAAIGYDLDKLKANIVSVKSKNRLASAMINCVTSLIIENHEAAVENRPKRYNTMSKMLALVLRWNKLLVNSTTIDGKYAINGNDYRAIKEEFGELLKEFKPLSLYDKLVFTYSVRNLQDAPDMIELFNTMLLNEEKP